MRSVGAAPEAWSVTRLAASRGGLLTAALVFFAIVWTALFVSFSASEELLAWDVRFAYLPAAEAVLDGESPYPALDDPILEEQKGYVYPPQLAIALTPLTPLPVDVAAALLAGVMIALLAATLAVLGIRDVRCYAAAFLWMPVTSGVLFANVSVPLAFALALAWRYRGRTWPPAVTLGLAVATKLVLWPTLVWLLATRRLGAALGAALVGLTVTLAAWAAIGFVGFREFPDLLRRLSEIQSENSYSVVGVAATLGLDVAVGNALALALGAGALLLCVIAARRLDDFRSFTWAVAASLLLSPIVWLHYLVVLLVPLAIARQRFSPLWLLPIVLVVSPRPGYPEGAATFLPMLVAAALLAVLLVRPSGRRGGGSVA